MMTVTHFRSELVPRPAGAAAWAPSAPAFTELHWSRAEGQRGRQAIDLAAVRHTLDRDSLATDEAVSASFQATRLTRLRLGGE